MPFFARLGRRVRGPVRETHSRLESRHLGVVSWGTWAACLSMYCTAYFLHTPGCSLGWHRILVALQASQAVWLRRPEAAS